jgi:hypothetical protein
MEMSKERWAGIAAGMAVVALCVWVWVRVPKTIEYEVVEIPVPKWCDEIDDLDINDCGVVAGTLRGHRFENDHLFLWDLERGLTDLGCPGFAPDPCQIQVTDINNKGQIVGTYGLKVMNLEGTSTKIKIPEGFFYDPQTGFRSIEPLKGFAESWLCSINDKGLVLGGCGRPGPDGEDQSRIFLWDPETGVRDLDLVGWPGAINNVGHLTGRNQGNYFIWSPEEGCRFLGDSAYGLVIGYTLNDSDEVVGFAGDPDSEIGMRLWRWNRKKGYRYFEGLGKVGYPISSMNDRKFLYFEHIKPFDWFGWVKNTHEGDFLRIYTIGEGVTIPLNLPEHRFIYQDFWTINRVGWIVGKSGVMIPMEKAGRKKD